MTLSPSPGRPSLAWPSSGDRDVRLVLAAVDHPVAVDLVVAGAAVEHVGRDGVVVLVAPQRVVPVAAADDVRAALSFQDRVVAGAAVDHVGARAGLDLVGALVAEDRLAALA